MSWSMSESMNHKSLLAHFITRQCSQRLLAEQGFSQDSSLCVSVCVCVCECVCVCVCVCVCLWGCVSGGVSTQQQKASARSVERVNLLGFWRQRRVFASQLRSRLESDIEIGTA